jgi:predicted nucleic acid-binding protein
MTFDDVQEGEGIFIDANIFVYHFGELSVECKNLLSRCARGEIAGYTSTAILAEVLHRLMIAEAIEKGYISEKNPVKQLKGHPEIIKGLLTYTADVEKIAEMNITIFDLTEESIKTSAEIQQSEGLLTNDSLAVATMKNAGLSNFATNDNDFDHISWLNIYKPSDV